MAFDANDLSPHEQFVVDRTSAGEIADFSAMGGPGGAKPAVRAGFLRKLLLRLDPSWAIRTPGVRIKGARIEGTLDLTDCSGEGLPALALINCEIPDAIDISHARLARLSLNGSRLTQLQAVEAQIDGELDLCDIAPIEAAGKETLTAKLRGARIDGDVLARGAKFARAEDSTIDALNLQGAEIEGNVFLREGFEAFGSVTIYGARIKGAVDCSGGAFLNRSDDAGASALIAETVRIEGDVLLRNGFKAEGEVWFMGATICGNLDLTNGSFRNELGCAIMLSNARVEGQVIADDVKVAGQLALQNAHIAHNLDLRGAEIVHRTTPRGDTFGRAIDGTSMKVGGGAMLQGANVKGEIFLADARIGGYLAFGGGRYINPGAWAIRAPNARVGSNLTFTLPENGFAPHGQKTVIEGGCKLARARIGGKLAWSALELRGPGPDGAKGGVFSFVDATIDGAIEARALTAQQETFIDAIGASCAALRSMTT